MRPTPPSLAFSSFFRPTYGSTTSTRSPRRLDECVRSRPSPSRILRESCGPPLSSVCESLSLSLLCSFSLRVCMYLFFSLSPDAPLSYPTKNKRYGVAVLNALSTTLRGYGPDLSLDAVLRFYLAHNPPAHIYHRERSELLPVAVAVAAAAAAAGWVARRGSKMEAHAGACALRPVDNVAGTTRVQTTRRDRATMIRLAHEFLGLDRPD